MFNEEKEITFIVCGVLRKEVEKLRNDGKLKGNFLYLNSLLHLNPLKLEQTLNNIKKVDKYGKKIIIYGDCHPTITENKNRTKAINCIEMILGKNEYKKILGKKIFCFLPEWTKRWKEIFEKDLGFFDSSGKELVKDMIDKVIYLDTKVEKIPYELLEEFKEIFDIEYEIKEVGLDNLLNFIKSAEENLYE